MKIKVIFPFRRSRRIRFLKRNEGHTCLMDQVSGQHKEVEAGLTSKGFEVVTAENGLNALSILSKTDNDLILLDVMIPEMNGFEVCRRIKNREEHRLIPIIDACPGVEFGT